MSVPEPDDSEARPRETLTRRSFLLGAAGMTALGLAACSSSPVRPARSTAPSPSPSSAAPPSAVPSPSGTPLSVEDCAELEQASGSTLWETAMRRGLVYGSSTATWQISDPQYRKLYERQAAILFTEDDLLWYRLKPTPEADLDFSFGDRIVGFAEKNGMLVFGAHLVWDEGFGEGWKDKDLYGLSSDEATTLLFGTVEQTVRRYRGRVAAWSVANEVLDGQGLRTDVPWFQTIGPTYVADAFHVAHDADPDALLVLNDFGFESDDGFAVAADKRQAALDLLDQLLADGVPVGALGVQAHLDASTFQDTFDPDAYREFLADVAGRGLRILITEMDVLDDGLPPDVGERDRAVADMYRTYLEAALEEPAVAAFMTFGLSDRYTWLQEDYPRNDGAARRPLPFDEDLRPKPSLDAVRTALAAAVQRDPAWLPPRC